MGGDRRKDGSFKKGCAPGPGRPAKAGKSGVSNEQLDELVGSADNGAILYLTAMQLKDREKQLASIDRHFSPEVCEKIRRLVQLADLAGEVVRRRLLAELAE